MVIALWTNTIHGQNLLGNPSFEQSELRGTARMPAAWDAWAYRGTTLRWADDYAHSGVGAAFIEVTPEGAAQFPQFCKRLKVRPGEHYRASIWARTESVVSSWGPQLSFEFFDEAGKRMTPIEGGQAGGGTHDWVKLTVEAFVPKGARELMFSAYLHREGKVWFDDAELTKVSEPDSFGATQLTVKVRPDRIANPCFLGFGCHGDNFLNVRCNTRHGVNEADRQLVHARVAAMRPKIMRVLFDYKWWEPAKGHRSTDGEFHKDLIDWIGFLKSIGCDVLVHPWGDCFAYSDWMLPKNDPNWGANPNSRLPIPSERDATVRSLADFLQYLRREKGLSNVRYVCLMNEPENDHRRPTPVAEYVRLNRLLARCLKDRGLDREILLLGPDDCTGQYNGKSLWWRQTVPQAIDVFGGLSSHTYKHRDTRLVQTWIKDRLDHARQLAPDDPARPMLVTEFGYAGLDAGTFDNPENSAYEYGLYMGDFAIEILNSGASAALAWCLFDQYYDDVHCQHYGLWEFKDKGWRPRPAFYSWSLINRYSEAKSRVAALEVTPAAESLRAAAMISPGGKLTLLVINRYDRDLQVTLHPGLARPARLRLYRYTQPALKAATGEMFGPSGEFQVAADGALTLPMPAESFALLTEFAGESETR